MADAQDIQKTVLGLINEARRKRSLNELSTLTTKDGATSLDFLNDIIEDMMDKRNWYQLRDEVLVTAVSGQATYTVSASASLVRNIQEIVFDNEIAAMDVQDILDVEQRIRASGNGTPRQYAITGVNVSAKPIIKVAPIPGSSQDGKVFTIKIFKQLPLYTSDDASVLVPLPSRPIVAGLMALLILDESDGAPTPQYQTHWAMYERLKKSALNKFTASTGDSIRFMPQYKGKR